MAQFSSKFLLFAYVSIAIQPLFGSYVRAQDADSSQKFVDTLTTKANSGDTAAQVMLSAAFYKKKDFSQAFVWAQKAADQGNPLAQTMVGEFYLRGEGAPESGRHAREWLIKAANQDFLEAEGDLGNMYYSGTGVPKDYAEALRWYLKAAEHHTVDPQIQFTLGMMYQNGWGATKDPKQAFLWIERAAKQDHQYAETMLGIMYAQGIGVYRNVIEARNWELKAAGHNVPDSYALLGVLYHEEQPINGELCT